MRDPDRPRHVARRIPDRDRQRGDTMSDTKRLARVLATRSGPDVELAFATSDGHTVKILASEEQMDRLVDELEDILNSPVETEPGEPPAAA